MNRAALEHVLRAASGITDHPDIVVVGSQAILASFPDAPRELLMSMEADIFPKGRPDLSIQIDGAIGERSLFHETFGYYAHGVDETTATLPPGWDDRLVTIHNANTGGATGWCLDVHDLAVSKLVAGREKDLEFVTGLVTHGLADARRIGALIESLETSPNIRELAVARLKRVTAS